MRVTVTINGKLLICEFFAAEAIDAETVMFRTTPQYPDIEVKGVNSAAVIEKLGDRSSIVLEDEKARLIKKGIIAFGPNV
ncbi:MAG: hypothetical protein J6U38_08765 [Clostridia bacterium]|jgi:hypothetical protein|nr:hypothetical protein [Clostridia bacterium]MBO7504446.1 hypothetical protein [Clostridia bacterium]MBP5765995.1 hypothetical protein [Clostridia bacterium]